MRGNADKITPKGLQGVPSAANHPTRSPGIAPSPKSPLKGPKGSPQLQIPPRGSPRITLSPNLLLLSGTLLAQLILLVLLIGVLVVVVVDVGVVVVVVLVVVVVVVIIVGVLVAHQGRGDPNSCACT